MDNVLTAVFCTVVSFFVGVIVARVFPEGLRMDWGNVPEWVAGLGSIGTVVIAWCALRSWRGQLSGTNKHAAATEIEEAARLARHRFFEARDPHIDPGEYPPAQEPFRRSVNRLLDRGESVHQLARIIHTGPIRSDRGRRREEKILISGALTLLTNAVIAYNTWKLHQALERRRVAGRDVPPDAILAHIAPIGFRHINFHGVYRFPLDRYLDRLMPSAMHQAIVVGG